jgi:hypothetical protein
MDLSPGQRKAAFAAIVIAFLALGAFLLISRAGKSPPTAHGGPPAASAPASPAPASPVATASAPPQPVSGVDIYRLLPFSQADLDQAIGVAQRFGARYGTYSYQQSASSYVAGLRGLATPGLAATLARSYATPGVAQVRTSQKQVSTGQGTVTALRAFGPSSLTFVVTVVQKITESQGRSQLSTQYAVTVTGGTGHWQVSDIQLASAGNA